MFRYKATAALAVTALLTLSACGGGSSSDSSSADGGSLTLTAVAAPTSMDVSKAEWGNRSPFYQASYDTLLYMSADGEVEPWLATDYSYNDDNTELTLTLRDDVTFTDGSTLTAKLVKENLERFQSGTSPDASYLAGITGISTPDDTTVVLKMAEPNPALVDYLTRDPGLIEAASMFKADDADTNPVGSGPYVLDTKASVTGTTYVYTANPDYWNADAVTYDDLTINVITDATAALNTVRSGEANGVKLVNNDSLDEVQSAGWTVNANELDVAGLLLLDRAGSQNKALGDVKVRQAINYAIDRAGLLTALQDGNGTVTEQMFPASSAAYDESLDSYYSYDPEKAKELLAEAGYADGVTIEMPSASALGATTYTLIKQELADVGITVKYTEVPVENFIADLLAPKYVASYMPLEQNPDWQLIQFMISPTAVFNPYHYSDDTVNKLLKEIQYGDTATQEAKAAELNKYLVEQAWFAPFYRVQGSFATDANTTVTMSTTNAYPSLFDFQPAS
ncbi:ABC transporter substrate-binding protein [Nocardioides sp. GY 10127]|uniref:ABC transporter substrate-binding protein n=1 Tax=Nocardioides sp. GY 10127 TaxID=2569762 RepID=UPI0010A83967|nr:ABC transporter substrate-binding protein [Nocardioides sp. GY 10127]TIC85481.1 peptide ABC transporter substrate-binding protein [Nocardioides sp. GY 10127]